MAEGRNSISIRLVLCAVAFTWPAVAQNSQQEYWRQIQPAIEDRDNAAYWYNRAIYQLLALPDEDFNALQRILDDPGAEPSQAARDLLAKMKPALDATRRAAGQDFSDFQINYAEGPGIHLLHLAPLRHLGVLLQADAVVKMRDGDTRRGAESIAAIIAMTDHFGSDGVGWSSRVGTAMLGYSDRAIQMAADGGTLGPAEGLTLLRAMNRLDESDPGRVLDSLAIDHEIFVDWLERTRTTEEGQAMLEQWKEQYSNEPGGVAASSAALLELNDEDFDKELGKFDQMTVDLVKACKLSDPEEARAAVAAIQEQFEGGEYGAIAQAFKTLMQTPKFTDRLESMQAAQAIMSNRTDQMRKIASGALSPEALAEENAATWYLRAIDKFETWDAQRLQALRDFFAQPRQMTISASLQESLSEAGEVVDLFREGSNRTRCDFAVARRGMSFTIPGYVPGMSDGQKLLQLDAVRLLQRGDIAGAVERLTVSLRVAAHLAQDERLISSRSSHTAFLRAVSFVQTLLEKGGLTAEQQSALRRAVDEMSPADPFGYLAAEEAHRSYVFSRWYGAARGPDRWPPYRTIKEYVGKATGNRLFFFSLVFFLHESAGVPDDQTNFIQPSSQLTDLLDAEAFTTAIDLGPVVLLSLRDVRMDELERWPVPNVADLDTRRDASRRDLRRAVQLLRVSD